MGNLIDNYIPKFNSILILGDFNAKTTNKTITEFCINFKKRHPTVINYRSYKKNNEKLLRKDLIVKLQNVNKAVISYDDFKETFMNAFEKYAPLKEKTIRGNTSPFMNKTLSKAFMKRSRLKNKFNIDHTNANKVEFKKKTFLCKK